MTATDTSRRDALVERLFESTIGALELFSVHLGWRLGLYDALRDGGVAHASGARAAAGIDGRYAREWLEQQAVAGFLEVDDAAAPDDARASGCRTAMRTCSPTRTAPRTSRRSRRSSSAPRARCRASSTPTAAATASHTSTTAPTSARGRA